MQQNPHDTCGACVDTTRLPANHSCGEDPLPFCAAQHTSDDGGVAGVVLRDVLLDLAHQVGAHISSLRAAKQGSQYQRDANALLKITTCFDLRCSRL